MQPFHLPSPGKRIGVISDTHSLLRPEALEALEGVHRILHAGDIGNPTHLDALARIASTDSFVGAHWRVRGEGGEGGAGEVVELALLSTAEADGGACVELLRGELHLLSIPEEGQFGWEK